MIRVESEETEDHARETLTISPEEADELGFVPSVLSEPLIKEARGARTTNVCKLCYNAQLMQRGKQPLVKNVGDFFPRRTFGSSGPGAGPGEVIRVSQSPGGVGLGDALQLPKEDIAGALWALRAPEASTVRRMFGGATPDHYGHLARVEVELLASARCAAGCVK